MSWLLLATLSALFLGLYDISKKAALNANAVLPVLLCSSLAGSLVVALAMLFSGLAPASAESIGMVVVPLSGGEHLLVLLKAGIVTSSWILSFFAVKHLPISIAAPVRASAPLFTLMGAVFLFGEAPSVRQWIGISVILLAYWGFSLVGRAEGLGFEQHRWIGLLLGGTLLGAISGLYDKHLLQQARLPPLTLQCWFTLYNAALQGIVVALLWWPRRRNVTKLKWRFSIPLVGVLLIIADSFYFRALAHQEALVSVVSLVRRSNVVVSFSLGALLFREKLLHRKAVILAGILFGVWLLLG